jgi:hypothetical protein
VEQDQHDHQETGQDQHDREESVQHGRDPTSRNPIARKGVHSTGMS